MLMIVCIVLVQTGNRAYTVTAVLSEPFPGSGVEEFWPRNELDPSRIIVIMQDIMHPEGQRIRTQLASHPALETLE